jgi:hypothetical protein
VFPSRCPIMFALCHFLHYRFVVCQRERSKIWELCRPQGFDPPRKSVI